MKSLVLAVILALSACPALAVEKVPMPTGATDIHFGFNSGECALIRIHAYGGVGTTNISNVEGCVNDVFSINFSFTGDPADGFYLLPIFKIGDAATVGRKTVVITDAYWTYNDVFYAPVWTDGIQRVAVVPEPGTWSMLVIGMGLIGAAARRAFRSRRSLVPAG